MNYAQLIDPEWARNGFPERFPAPRPAGIPDHELRVVTKHETPPGTPAAGKPRGRGKRSGAIKKIGVVLANASRPLTAVEIAQIDGELVTSQVSTAMKPLVDGGRVKRTGPWGRYAYAITAKGREWL